MCAKNHGRFDGRKRFTKVDIFIKYLKHFFYFCALIGKTFKFKRI